MRLLFQFDSSMHTYLQIHTMFQMLPMLFLEEANDSWKGRRDVQQCKSETIFQLGPLTDRADKLNNSFMIQTPPVICFEISFSN